MRRTLVALALFLPVSSALGAQEPSAGIYALAQVETQPRPSNVREFVAALHAAYPADKRAAGQGATVQVAFVVGTDGVPRDASVTTSTDAAFDSVTLASLSALRFTPATVSGRPVPVRIELPVQWTPADPESDGPATSGASGERPAAGPDGTGVYALRDVDVAPRPQNIAEMQRAMVASYPPALREAGVDGTAQVRFRVDAQGVPHDFVVTASSDPGFAQPTLNALSVLRFTPARKDGRPVDVWVELPVTWTAPR